MPTLIFSSEMLLFNSVLASAAALSAAAVAFFSFAIYSKSAVFHSAYALPDSIDRESALRLLYA